MTALPNTVCAGSPISLQATPGDSPRPYSYTWTAPSGTTLGSTSLNPTTATATTAGVYSFSILVRDAVGCLATGSVSVTVNPLSTATILTPASATLTCNTTALSLTATGGGTVSVGEWHHRCGTLSHYIGCLLGHRYVGQRLYGQRYGSGKSG